MAKPTPKSVLTASIATVAGIGIIAAACASKLKPAELIDGIIAYQGAKDKAYAAVGKLRYYLERSIADSGAKTTITEVLRTKAGLTAGTISNTAYGAKVFALVESKDLTEEEYDGLKFAECYGIVRVMSKDSKRPLSAAEVAVLVRDSRATLDDECQSIAKTGKTLAEATAEAEKAMQDAEAARLKKAEEDKAAAESAQAAADAKKGANDGKTLAETQAEADQAKATAEAARSGSPTPTPDDGAPTGTTPEQPAAPVASETPEPTETETAAETPSDTPAPATGDAPEVPAETPVSATPSNITPMTNEDAILTKCADQLDAMLHELAKVQPVKLAAFLESTVLPFAKMLADNCADVEGAPVSLETANARAAAEAEALANAA